MNRNMPIGKEMRFSEHVAAELRAGRFKPCRWFGLDDREEFVSPDADLYEHGRNDSYEYGRNDSYSVEMYDRNVFGVKAWREFSFRRFRTIWRVRLTRGRKNISNLLAPFEIELLVDAWQEAYRLHKLGLTEKQKADEAARQRAAWWP